MTTNLAGLAFCLVAWLIVGTAVALLVADLINPSEREEDR